MIVDTEIILVNTNKCKQPFPQENHQNCHQKHHCGYYFSEIKLKTSQINCSNYSSLNEAKVILQHFWKAILKSSQSKSQNQRFGQPLLFFTELFSSFMPLSIQQIWQEISKQTIYLWGHIGDASSCTCIRKACSVVCRRSLFFFFYNYFQFLNLPVFYKDNILLQQNRINKL